jgi:hypothetical protein
MKILTKKFSYLGLPKGEKCPIGEHCPNLVTLIVAPPFIRFLRHLVVENPTTVVATKSGTMLNNVKWTGGPMLRFSENIPLTPNLRF